MTALWTDTELAAPSLQAPPAASAQAHDAAQRAAYENHKLEKRLCRQVGQAIMDYHMIEEGDRVMVCVSGGKL